MPTRPVDPVAINLRRVTGPAVMREKMKRRKLLRWTILILAVAGGLFLLNSAFFCAWVSGGPPNDYPKVWLHQSYVYFGYSGALIATGILCFVRLREQFVWKKSIAFYLWITFTIYCLSGPVIRKHILIDKCLDAGGKWDQSHFVCRDK